ncbi:MAG: hypothetical protein HQK51_11605 [Oligoflexia bacterium]|nr:hypothetical protein [Oligoflexia bacterium]
MKINKSILNLFILLTLISFPILAMGLGDSDKSKAKPSYNSCRSYIFGEENWHTWRTKGFVGETAWDAIKKECDSFVNTGDIEKNENEISKKIEELTSKYTSLLTKRDDLKKEYYNCAVIDALTSTDESPGIPDAGQGGYQPKSTGMMMMGMVGGGGGGGGAIPGQAGANNPMMAMMMGGSLQCKSNGKQTQDYTSCKNLLQTYDVTMMLQLTQQQAESIHMQINQLDAQKESIKANGTDANLQLKQLKKQMENATIIAGERAGMELLKSGLIAGLASRMPDREKLVDNCKSLVKDENNLKKLEELFNYANCSDENLARAYSDRVKNILDALGAGAPAAAPAAASRLPPLPRQATMSNLAGAAPDPGAGAPAVVPAAPAAGAPGVVPAAPAAPAAGNLFAPPPPSGP